MTPLWYHICTLKNWLKLGGNTLNILPFSPHLSEAVEITRIALIFRSRMKINEQLKPKNWFWTEKKEQSLWLWGKLLIFMGSSGFREGAGDVPFSPQGFDSLPTQRVSLCTILRYPFLADWPENFSKGAFGANLYWVGARAEKTQFFRRRFPKTA